ncbi:hypothetical protein [Marinobacter sp. ANT_B65]|uniref:hypothetical protein n=1 Tax=Marinobacter sp. ANT_B65 TaxID=2039467 RepID=UPI0015CC5A57|nr:hypothetical protein [Marinobacter sp. ANT_B65]
MSFFEDRKLTSNERVEITRRKLEIALKKEAGKVNDLAELKKELGIEKRKD